MRVGGDVALAALIRWPASSPRCPLYTVSHLAVHDGYGGIGITSGLDAHLAPQVVITGCAQDVCEGRPMGPGSKKPFDRRPFLVARVAWVPIALSSSRTASHLFLDRFLRVEVRAWLQITAFAGSGDPVSARIKP